ncbi:MAG: hypothetical protein JKY50_15295 [Oleispira sp.]|nr:hypothetical protein [Oleispira sp.]MBL4882592.1 hypothetical protein [Oleispira sp.]
MKHAFKKSLGLSIGLLASISATAENWQAVNDASELKKLFTSTVFEATLKGGEKATADYNADGTGQLNAWGDSFKRSWEVQGDNQVCINIDNGQDCYTIEKNLDQPNQYRVTRTDQSETAIVTISNQSGMIEGTASTDKGGAAQPSAEEMAEKLSNPTSPVMTIGNHIDLVFFDGDLDGAADESSTRYVFQTVFPFKQDDGGVVFFRPAIPVFFDEPVPGSAGDFDAVGTEIGDISFDLSYGKTEPNGLLWGAGLAAIVPTATDDRLGKNLWAAGPEILFGTLGKWGTVGGLLAHQWDYAGSGDGEINSTALSYWYAFPLGGGWQFASGPVATYDHSKDDDQLALPLGIGLAKTSILNGRPWKFQVQYWNYVERDDTFAAEHLIRFSISPVVSAPWNVDI